MVVLDNLVSGHRAAVEGVPLVEGDVGDRRLLRRILAEEAYDAVVHLAGSKSVADSVARPEQYFAGNVGDSLRFAAAVVEAGIRIFVFSSSAAVYGAVSEPPVTEDAPLVPANPYGESKLMVERALHWLAAAHPMRYAALRYFNAAGAALDGTLGEDWSAATNLIPLVMRAALLEGERVPVYGTDYPTPDGTAIRDYVHVVDLAEAHARALEHLATGPSFVANLGTGRGSSVREILAAVERISGRPVSSYDAPRRSGDPPAVWADTELAAKILGWRARLTLDDIVSTAWQWYQRHAADAGRQRDRLTAADR